jgi:hypothetical protein
MQFGRENCNLYYRLRAMRSVVDGRGPVSMRFEIQPSAGSRSAHSPRPAVVGSFSYSSPRSSL